MNSNRTFVGIAGAAWAIIGIVLMLGIAIYRLALRAAEALGMEWHAGHWAVFILFTAFMAHAEGYRGFQKSFSPRTAARVHYLGHSNSLLHSLLGPIFAMGFYHANRRTKIVAWALLIGITILVLLIRLLEQPWRGIIDAGVVVGLSWGLVSLLVFVGRAFSRRGPDAAPELPPHGCSSKPTRN